MREARFEERSFHAWLEGGSHPTAKVPLPIGDDAAALRTTPRRLLFATTDGFTEGYHFLEDSPPRAVGRALVGANASDLAAKGGRPVAFLLGLFQPPRTPSRWSREVVTGVREALRPLGAPLVGGDSKPARARMLVGTFLGEATSANLAPHSGARPGDLLYLTGTVGAPGWAAARLRAAGARTRRRARERLLKITPRLLEGERLIRHAHAMIDTSDGFAEASRILAAASGCRLVVEESRLPFDSLLQGGGLTVTERLRLAVYGAEYELLAAVPARASGRLERNFAGGRPGLTRIGRVERGQGAYLERSDELRPLPPSGWRPWG